MSQHLASFFTAQAHHFTEGRLESMARPYCVPLPVSLDNRFYFLRTHDDVVAALRAKRDGATCAGLRSLRIGVTAERTCSRDHMTAEVEWFYFARSGRREARTRVRYFLSRPKGTLAIEMVEYLELAFPEMRMFYSAFAVPRTAPRPHSLH